MNTLKKMSLFILILIATISFSIGQANAAKSSEFKDVPKSLDGHDDIISLANQGIINGYPDNTYRPYNKLTRAQGAIIIGRALDIDTNQSAQHTFTDVNKKVSGYPY